MIQWFLETAWAQYVLGFVIGYGSLVLWSEYRKRKHPMYYIYKAKKELGDQRDIRN